MKKKKKKKKIVINFLFVLLPPDLEDFKSGDVGTSPCQRVPHT